MARSKKAIAKCLDAQKAIDERAFTRELVYHAADQIARKLVASKAANDGRVPYGYSSELLKAANITFPQLSRRTINNHVVRIERAGTVHECNTTADRIEEEEDQTLDLSLPGDDSESEADEEIENIEPQPPDSEVVDIESIDGSEATFPPDFGRPKGTTDTAKRGTQ